MKQYLIRCITIGMDPIALDSDGLFSMDAIFRKDMTSDWPRRCEVKVVDGRRCLVATTEIQRGVAITGYAVVVANALAPGGVILKLINTELIKQVREFHGKQAAARLVAIAVSEGSIGEQSGNVDDSIGSMNGGDEAVESHALEDRWSISGGSTDMLTILLPLLTHQNSLGNYASKASPNLNNTILYSEVNHREGKKGYGMFLVALQTIQKGEIITMGGPHEGEMPGGAGSESYDDGEVSFSGGAGGEGGGIPPTIYPRGEGGGERGGARSTRAARLTGPQGQADAGPTTMSLPGGSMTVGPDLYTETPESPPRPDDRRYSSLRPNARQWSFRSYNQTSDNRYSCV